MRAVNMNMTYPGHVHDLGDEFWAVLPQRLPIKAELMRSRPSIVETGFRQAFLRTALAPICKFPSRLETLYTVTPKFKFYGGWEVLIRRAVSGEPNPSTDRLDYRGADA
jgi:hypothetical protein